MGKKAPPELEATRPAIAEQESVDHPSTGAPLGPPPRRYTLGLHTQIVELIKQGNRPPVAAAAAGITPATFHEWMRRGKDGDPHLYQFALDVDQAFALAETAAIETVRKAMLENPEYAKWYLERARADGYSKQVNMMVESQLQAFMKRLEEALDPETFHKVLAVYAGQYVPTENDDRPAVH